MIGSEGLGPGHGARAWALGQGGGGAGGVGRWGPDWEKSRFVPIRIGTSLNLSFRTVQNARKLFKVIKILQNEVLVFNLGNQ